MILKPLDPYPLERHMVDKTRPAAAGTTPIIKQLLTSPKMPHIIAAIE